MAAQATENPTKQLLGRVIEGVAVLVIVGSLSEAYSLMKAVLQRLEDFKTTQGTQQMLIQQLGRDLDAVKASGAELQKQARELEQRQLLQGFEIRQLSK